MTQPWHGDLIATLFAGGPSFPVEQAAEKVGKSLRSVKKYLASPEGQAALAEYERARRAVVVERKVRPLDKLAGYAEEAVDGLMEALRLARENENIRELRETATAILAHVGMGPVKRTEKKVTHLTDQITDPLLLARIINGDVTREELEQLPPPASH